MEQTQQQPQPKACEALTGRCHPCRGYAQPNGLCHLHQTFFQPERFFTFVSKHCDFIQATQKRDWVIRAMKSRLFEPSIYYEEQIKEGYKNNTDAWRRGSAMYLYELFVKSEAMAPYAIPSLWKHYIANRIDILRYTAPHNRTETMMQTICIEYFKAFFRETPIQETLMFVLRILLLSNTLTNEILPFILTTLFVSIPPYQLICLNREEIIASLNRLSSIKDFGPFLSITLPIMDAHYTVALNIVKYKGATLKEDSIAAAWNPDRFMRWCLTVDETERIQGYLSTGNIRP